MTLATNDVRATHDDLTDRELSIEALAAIAAGRGFPLPGPHLPAAPVLAADAVPDMVGRLGGLGCLLQTLLKAGWTACPRQNSRTSWSGSFSHLRRGDAAN